ncbi:MAG: NAD(P)-dependent oxidoreductase [Hyphomicrobium sp.]|nr:NAD(P)-dependent oxidoreductase [Hyphomicrobium sp.]
MANVSILGLGAMGSRMAANLIKAGHTVAVWNRDPNKAAALVAAGAKLASTPRAAAAGADVVIAMVRDDAASRAIWLDREHGALAGLSRDAIAIESSTLTANWVRELGETAAKSGIAFLDAPVAGSRPQAEAGQLIYFVGGDASVFARAEPVLKAMGGAVHHAGAVGSGAGVKLMVNALFGIQLAAMGELIGFSKKLGLDTAKAIEIVGTTPVCSPAANLAAGAMLAGNFTPMFPIELVEKDFGYVIDEAGRVGAKVPVSLATRNVFGDAKSHGFGADNITGVVNLFI